MKKKKVYLITILLVTLLFVSCDKDIVDPLKDKGTIFVDSNPEKAAIYIDGKSTGKFTPGAIEVTAGRHHGSVRKNGFADAQFTAEVTVGNEFKVPALDMSKYGVFQIKSEPEQAQIWIDGNNSRSSTPNNFSLSDGQYSVTLKFEEYKDTTFAIEILDAQDIIVKINLQPTFVSKYHGVLWDTTKATNTQPSGVQLSTGRLLTIKPGSGQSKIADIFFTPDGLGKYIVRSADGVNGMNRLTRFKVSKYRDINDGRNAPIDDLTWTESFLTSNKNYIFMFDNEGHYSKFQIIRRFEHPARIEVRWIYNDLLFDNSF